MIHRTGPSPGAALVILLCAALALSAVLAPASHEGREPAPNDGAEPRVLLIGLDAADWIMLDRWIEQGELPHLARLARTGLRGDLRTLRPIISPLVWTSIATGQTPDRHGVTDFFSGRDRENGLRPVSRHSVSVPTLWEILSDRGLDVAITAWWASWPADPTLNGRVVTDQVQFIFPGPVQGADPDSALYHPPDLAGRLDHCLVSPETLDARAVSAIAPCTTADRLVHQFRLFGKGVEGHDQPRARPHAAFQRLDSVLRVVGRQCAAEQQRGSLSVLEPGDRLDIAACVYARQTLEGAV